mgnify:CR=1 FL=1
MNTDPDLSDNSRPAARSPAGAIRAFPRLTDADIARIRRFGEVRRYERGASLFATRASPPPECSWC